MRSALAQTARALAAAHEHELEPRLRIKWEQQFLEARARRFREAEKAVCAFLSSDEVYDRLLRDLAPDAAQRVIKALIEVGTLQPLAEKDSDRE